MTSRAGEIVSGALDGNVLSREDSLYLLDLSEDSPEASVVIDSANRFMKERVSGVGKVGVQIGVVTGPCYADCAFCGFAASTTDQEAYVMPLSVLERYVCDSISRACVSSISLMAIHDATVDEMLPMVELVRSTVPDDVSVAVNMGDLSLSECRKLKSAGADSAYHALRLGEGVINMLEPYWRVRTMDNLLSAGINVYSGVEPVGPEHSSKEILNLFDSVKGRCTACSASAREPVPGCVMADSDTVSSRRMDLIRSALVFAGMDGNGQTSYGGFYGGFDCIYAELAGSPKDIGEMSELSLGRTVDWAVSCLETRGYSVRPR